MQLSLYLPAWRNPIDQLARREARVLVELLRAQQQHINGSRSLVDLRQRAWGFLEVLTKDSLINAVENRISEQLAHLTAGVRRQWPYVRGQVVDDNYLARVLELMLAVLEGRDFARPLDVSALGYVNLLHSAVTLAAIPDLGVAAGESNDVVGGDAAPEIDPAGDEGAAEAADSDSESARAQLLQDHTGEDQSPEGIKQVEDVTAAAQEAIKGTSLSNAKISLAGAASNYRDVS
jgi:putative ATP-dependent endonuclease of OLD family